jgi:hypothetical protein
MKTREMLLFSVLVAFVAFVSPRSAEAPAPKDKRKHMDLGQYVTSREDCQMSKADPAI